MRNVVLQCSGGRSISGLMLSDINLKCSLLCSVQSEQMMVKAVSIQTSVIVITYVRARVEELYHSLLLIEY